MKLINLVLITKFPKILIKKKRKKARKDNYLDSR